MKGFVMTETKTILTPSLYVFATELEDHVKAGWSIDIENQPPVTWGVSYEVGLVRETEDGVQPKLTPAERMAKAREARAAKKSAQQGSDE
jgi:hypothetical protein